MRQFKIFSDFNNISFSCLIDQKEHKNQSASRIG